MLYTYKVMIGHVKGPHWGPQKINLRLKDPQTPEIKGFEVGSDFFRGLLAKMGPWGARIPPYIPPKPT